MPGEHVVQSDVQSATETLFEECGALAYSLAWRLLGDDQLKAEGVVESVFAELSRDISSWKKVDRPDLPQVVVNRVRQRCLGLLRDATLSTSEPRNHTGEVVQQSTEGSCDTAPRVREALLSLPFRERTAVEMAYFDGRTSEGIAIRTRGTVHDVHRQLRVGLQRLAVVLGEDDTPTPSS